MSFLLNLPWLASPLFVNIVCKAIEHQASTTSKRLSEITDSILFHITFYPFSTSNGLSYEHLELQLTECAAPATSGSRGSERPSQALSSRL